MSALAPPAMTDTPPFPVLADRAAGTYNRKAFAFGTHMSDVFNDELEAVATNVYDNALEAEASVIAATAKVVLATGQAVAAHNEASAAASAALVLGVLVWVSDTIYTIGQVCYSPLDNLSYRRRTNGGGTIDPSIDGTNWASTAASPIARVQVFTASGSWTCPPSVYRAKLTVVGGGGGSNTNTTTNATCGGGGGGAAIKWQAVVPGVTYTVTVGAGGAGGSGATSTGSAGGTSSFAGSGITTVSATGGQGAAGNATPGGTGSNGDLNIAGGATSSGGGDTTRHQPGGASYLAMPASYGAAGTGCGGGGGSTAIASTTGNAGAAGVVIVEY